MNFEYLLDLCQNTILPMLARFGTECIEFVFNPIDWREVFNTFTIWDNSPGIDILVNLMDNVFGLETSLFELCLLGFIGLTAYRIVKSLLPNN